MDGAATCRRPRKGREMGAHRVGALACFVLTAQFLLTVMWVVVAWPPGGFSGLADAMAQSFLGHVNDPFIWFVLNFYNVSFALSATVVGLVLRDQFGDLPRRAQMFMYLILIAAALYVVSGVVPMIALPDLINAGDTPAVNAVVAISTAFLLGATMVSGFVLLLGAAIFHASRRVPLLLCGILVVAGAIEIAEFAVPVFLFLDPFIGAFWSVWLGVLLWMNRLARPEAAEPSAFAAGDDRRASITDSYTLAS